jgi:hypothetical protein
MLTLRSTCTPTVSRERRSHPSNLSPTDRRHKLHPFPRDPSPRSQTGKHLDHRQRRQRLSGRFRVGHYREDEFRFRLWEYFLHVTWYVAVAVSSYSRAVRTYLTDLPRFPRSRSTECHGDPTNPNTPPRPYSTRQNDTWSLGVILVNLITGRNPWRQADVTDDTYRAFLADPTVLQTILPISDEAWACLRRVFVPEAERIGLRELRGMIQGVKRFSVGSSPPPPPPPPPPSVLARPSSTTRQPVDRPFSTYQPWNHLPSLSPCPFPSSVYPNTSFLSFGNEHDLPHHLPPLVAQTSSSSDDDPVFPLTPEAWSPFTGTGTGHAFQVGLNSAYASGSGVNGTVIGTESGRGRRFEEYSPRGQGAVYAPISNALSTTTTKTRKEERFYSPWPTREHQIHGGFTPAPSALTTKTRLESFQYSTIPCSKRDRDPSLQQPQQLPCDLHEEGLVPSRFRPGTQRYYTHTHAREAIPDSTIEGYFNV